MRKTLAVFSLVFGVAGLSAVPALAGEGCDFGHTMSVSNQVSQPAGSGQSTVPITQTAQQLQTKK